MGTATDTLLQQPQYDNEVSWRIPQMSYIYLSIVQHVRSTIIVFRPIVDWSKVFQKPALETGSGSDLFCCRYFNFHASLASWLWSSSLATVDTRWPIYSTWYVWGWACTGYVWSRESTFRGTSYYSTVVLHRWIQLRNEDSLRACTTVATQAPQAQHTCGMYSTTQTNTQHSPSMLPRRQAAGGFMRAVPATVHRVYFPRVGCMRCMV